MLCEAVAVGGEYNMIHFLWKMYFIKNILYIFHLCLCTFIGDALYPENNMLNWRQTDAAIPSQFFIIRGGYMIIEHF